METKQRSGICTHQDPAPATSSIRKLTAWLRLALLGLLSYLPPGLSTRLRYLYRLRRIPSFRRPRTFNEWLNHLKLYDRTRLRGVFADRIGVRDYVAERAPVCQLVPILGTFMALTSDIWDRLPDRFVLKATHGSGMVHIVHNKPAESFESVCGKTERWLAVDFGRLTSEWIYDALPRRLLAEGLLDDGSGRAPLDYKFFCFGGRVGMVQVDLDRFTHHVRNLYTRDFTRIPGELAKAGGPEVARPAAFDAGVVAAEQLSRGIDFVRVDLYLIGNAVYFGEMTCFPGSGFEEFRPRQLDRDLGLLLSAARVVQNWPRSAGPDEHDIGAAEESAPPKKSKAKVAV